MKRQEKQLLKSDDGLIVPQAISVERAILGALMVEPNAFCRVVTILTPECFYSPVNREIYNEMLKLENTSTPIDLLSVSTAMSNNEILIKNGGLAYLSKLTSLVSGVVNISAHAYIVKQKYIARKIIEAAENVRLAAYDATIDISEAIDSFNNALHDVNEIITGGGNVRSMMDVTRDCLLQLDYRQLNASKGRLNGIPTGFEQLDELTGGWQGGQLVVIGARPAMGKTAVALNIVKTAAEIGVPSCVYSLEMSSTSLGNRFILSEASVSKRKFRDGELSSEEILEVHRGAGRLEKLPIYIDDKPAVTINYIKNHARLMKGQGKCGLIVVDYLQLVGSSSTERNINREQQIAQISRGAKIVAKELNVPFIILAQLNRDAEKRGDKMPQLADLRESGAIEQDADLIGFLFRPAYYQIEEVEYNGKRIDSKGIGVIKIAKQREGETGFVFFRHNETMTQFSSVDPF